MDLIIAPFPGRLAPPWGKPLILRLHCLLSLPHASRAPLWFSALWGSPSLLGGFKGFVSISLIQVFWGSDFSGLPASFGRVPVRPSVYTEACGNKVPFKELCSSKHLCTHEETEYHQI